MRDITDERNNILELQRYLRELFYDTNGKIPLVNPDGIYGDETRAAVRAFREQNGLPEGDFTDNVTWDAIYREYREAVRRRARPASIFPFPEEDGYTVKSGERSDIVSIIQLMLLVLKDIYDDIGGNSMDGTYGSGSQDDIRAFQRSHGLPITGEVDKATWNALAEAYNRQVRVRN